MVQVWTDDTPLSPKAEHLKAALMANPRHALAPRAIICDLLAAGVSREEIKAMVPLWPGLAPLANESDPAP
jgi:hypothetical protein